MRSIAAALALAAVLPALATGTSARAADAVTLRLDWVHSGYHAAWHYAKDKGVFSKHGIDLSIKEGRGSLTTAQTVGNQSDEFGTSDAGAMMVLRSKGLAVKIVAGWLRTGPNALIYPKAKGWKTWKDVNNATITDSAGGSTIYLFKAVEKAQGLKGNKVVLVAPTAKVSTVLSGNADGTNSFGFLQAPQMDAAGTPATYLSFADAGINMPGLAVIASDALIASKKDLVARMVAATQETLKLVQTDPEGAMDSMLKVKPDMDRKVHSEILKLSFPLFDSAAAKGKPIGFTPPEDIEQAQNILVEYEQIEKKLPISDYFTNEFVK